MAIKNNFHEQFGLVLFILPAVVILLFSQLYPLLYSLVMSFRDWALARSLQPGGFVGLQNYMTALKDPLLLNAVRISVIFAFFSTTFTILLGFTLAYFTVGENILMRLSRSLLIIPMVIAPVASGTLWRMMLNPRTGLINQLLGFVGIKGPVWLGTPTLALFSVISSNKFLSLHKYY